MGHSTAIGKRRGLKKVHLCEKSGVQFILHKHTKKENTPNNYEMGGGGGGGRQFSQLIKRNVYLVNNRQTKFRLHLLLGCISSATSLQAHLSSVISLPGSPP